MQTANTNGPVVNNRDVNANSASEDSDEGDTTKTQKKTQKRRVKNQ